MAITKYKVIKKNLEAVINLRKELEKKVNRTRRLIIRFSVLECHLSVILTICCIRPNYVLK